MKCNLHHWKILIDHTYIFKFTDMTYSHWIKCIYHIKNKFLTNKQLLLNWFFKNYFRDFYVLAFMYSSNNYIIRFYFKKLNPKQMEFFVHLILNKLITVQIIQLKFRMDFCWTKHIWFCFPPKYNWPNYRRPFLEICKISLQHCLTSFLHCQVLFM